MKPRFAGVFYCRDSRIIAGIQKVKNCPGKPIYNTREK